MDRVVKPRIRADTTLEAPCTAIDLAEELYLQPPLITLDRLCRAQGTREFRYADKLHRRYQVHQPLRDSYKRTDLPNPVYLAAIYRRYSRDIVVEGHGDRRA